jgi:putative aldouronate transport system substrate-binding protein
LAILLRIAAQHLDGPPEQLVSERVGESAADAMTSAGPPRVDRRAFLRLAAAGSVGLIFLGAACGQAAAPAAPPTAAPRPTTAAPTTAPTTAATAPPPAAPTAPPQAAPPTVGASTVGGPSHLVMPTYLPATTGPRPDFPASDAGLQAGYLTYPADLARTVTSPPGSGGDVTAIVQTSSPPPTALDSNAAWQEVNRQLNANVKVQAVSSTDYRSRVAVMMAGNDQPDLFFYSHTLTATGIPQFLKAAYTDLTPFVSGDAIKDYPNLAAFPTSAWKQTIVEGAIYGVPVVRPSLQNVPFINQSRFEAAGVSQPRTGDDFKRILQELTKPQSNQFGIGGLAPGYGLVFDGRGEVPQLAMFGAPNDWAVDRGGKFTKDIETEQFAAALGYVRDLYAAGVFFPDPTLSQTTARSSFLGGRIGVITTGWAAYGSLLWDPGSKQNPPVKVRTLRPFSVDGSPPIWHQSQGFNGMTALKKASPDRTRELLRILNFLAAPFGSEEYHLLNYGLKDVDYTVDDTGNPVLTARGAEDVRVGWPSIVLPMAVLFDPNDPEMVRAAYADQQAMVQAMIPDPSIGLFSPTDLSVSGTLTGSFFDGIGEIVTGRAPLSNLEPLRQAWRSGGGDRIRMELQQAYAEAQR